MEVHTMKIEHIAMYVNDLKATKDFFVKYLNGNANDGYHSKIQASALISSLLRMVRDWNL